LGLQLLSKRQQGLHENRDGSTGMATRRPKPNGVGILASIDYRVKRMIRSTAPEVRVGLQSRTAHLTATTVAKRLAVEDWPTCMATGRAAWPSHPTFFEWIEMKKRGISQRPHEAPAFCRRVSYHEFHKNHELMVRVVSRNIIGIRSDVAIPGDFLQHFRYRWNFLILTSYAIPYKLVRFLINVWKRDPYSLWLERNGTLKQYLRAVPPSVYDRSVTVRSEFEGSSNSEHEGSLAGSTSSSYEDSYYGRFSD
jgi:hypothetical protein